MTTMVFQGFVARAQCLHEGSVQMIEAGSPHAASTLLRADAENVAAILYAKDHPNLLRHWSDLDGHGIQIGRITNYARTRFGGFNDVYDQLSKFAHPQARGLFASSRIIDGEERTMQWRSSPHFKRDEDRLTAYAWAIELAEASKHLLYEFAQAYQIGGAQKLLKAAESGDPSDQALMPGAAIARGRRELMVAAA